MDFLLLLDLGLLLSFVLKGSLSVTSFTSTIGYFFYFFKERCTFDLEAKQKITIKAAHDQSCIGWLCLSGLLFGFCD